MDLAYAILYAVKPRRPYRGVYLYYPDVPDVYTPNKLCTDCHILYGGEIIKDCSALTEEEQVEFIHNFFLPAMRKEKLEAV
jgi:hypothetical protein